MPPQRFSDQPPEGSRPDDPERWHAYDDGEAARADTGWSDDDADPFDRRALPRRRPGSWRLARVLAWTGGAALLMVVGGALALAVWPRALDVPPLAAPPADSVIATAPAGAESPERAPRGALEPRATPDPAPAPDRDAPEARSAAQPDPPIVPPPLPPLPPSLERATPPPPAAGEAAAPVEAQPPAQLPAYAPRDTRGAMVPPPPPPAQDSRSSEEIMADFLVSTGDRARAENTARTYANWYPAGSAERRYWSAVFEAIRRRP
jgi:hypothetical protein